MALSPATFIEICQDYVNKKPYLVIKMEVKPELTEKELNAQISVFGKPTITTSTHAWVYDTRSHYGELISIYHVDSKEELLQLLDSLATRKEQDELKKLAELKAKYEGENNNA